MMEMDTADIVFQGNNLSSEINLLGVSSHCYKVRKSLVFVFKYVNLTQFALI